MKRETFVCPRSLLALLFLSVLVPFAAAQNKINLEVDATRAPMNIVHVKESIAATPGTFDLFYPKWIPGEHSPTGTINDVVNLYFVADGKPLEWQRDPVEMFAFHVTVPDGATKIEVDFDDVSQPGTIATANLARIKWNRLLMYPRGVRSDQIMVSASMKYPSDWKYATTLPIKTESAGTVNFGDENLTSFVDSPAIIGKYFVKIPL